MFFNTHNEMLKMVLQWFVQWSASKLRPADMTYYSMWRSGANLSYKCQLSYMHLITHLESDHRDEGTAKSWNGGHRLS